MRKSTVIRAGPAVSRAVFIIRLLGDSNVPLNLKTISDSLNILPSTCLHIIRVLVHENLVQMDSETKKYQLANGLISLARSVINKSDFASLVQPTLDAISKQWGVTAMGVEVSSKQHIVVMALSKVESPFRLYVDVGSRFPTLVSATGRLAAAFSDQSWEELEEQFKKIRWDKPIKFKDWKTEVDLAHKQGFSVDRNNYIDGITLIATPILNQNGFITHTLVVASLSNNLSQKKVNDLAAELKTKSKSLELYI